MSTATQDPAVGRTVDHGYDGPPATPEFDHTSSPADDVRVRTAATHPADPAYVERDDLGRKTPAQIEREIAATRGRMDTTIERLKTRLQPSNLVDEVLAGFGITPSDVDRSASETVRTVGRRTASAIRNNPVPSALVAAAGLYKIFVDDEDHHDRPEFEIAEPAGYRKAYDPATGRMSYTPRVPAWSNHYAWDDDVHQKTWTDAASEKLEALKATLADTKRSAGEKLKTVSETLTSLSSVSQDELHDQWDGLREVNGSFVDARTGEPYSDDYGNEFRRLLAAHHARSGELPEDDEGWQEMAEATVADISERLNDAGSSAADKLSAASTSFGNLMGSCWDSTCSFTSAAADKSAATGRSTAAAIRGAASSAYGATARGAGVAYDATARGASAAYDASARGASAVAGGVSAAGSSVASGLSAAGSSIADGASYAGSSIADGASYAGEATTDAARRVSRKTAVAAKKVWHKTGDTYDDYPLAMGAAAVGVGLLAGLLLPRTRFEDRTYGEKSDRLKEEAAQLGEQAVEAGKHVADATVEAAHAKAREEGIAPEQVKSKAEALAEEAKKTASDLADQATAKAKSVADDVRLTAAVAAEDAAQAAKGAAKTAHQKAEDTPTDTAAGSVRMKVEEVVATAAETAKDEAAKAAKKISS